MTEVKAKRVRRTAEEARRHILEAAEAVLLEQGHSGLTLVRIAKQAGMAHSSLLHHFGDIESLKLALATHVQQVVLHEVLEKLQPRHGEELDIKELVSYVFTRISDSGYARLFAWMVASKPDAYLWDLQGGQDIKRLIGDLKSTLTRRISEHREITKTTAPGNFANSNEQASAILVLVISSVFGHGIVNSFLPDALDVDNNFFQNQFVDWLSNTLLTAVDT
ncbi:MAG: TetR/AcrR family transcriptional regulator [Parvibaculaceae bacterium]|nr:TetR/AcrR family transcriptional regulator [Parvibaculaceae bacterium]